MQRSSRRGGTGAVRWVAAASMALGMLGCSGSHEPHRGASHPPVRHVQVAPTTDVPALLGRSIDGLRQRLGSFQPLPRQYTASQASAVLAATQSPQDSLAAFCTGGLYVLATYDIHSRQVRDLLLLGHHEDSLMGRARLRASAADYLVMPVFYDNHSFRLLGLRVIATK